MHVPRWAPLLAAAALLLPTAACTKKHDAQPILDGTTTTLGPGETPTTANGHAATTAAAGTPTTARSTTSSTASGRGATTTTKPAVADTGATGGAGAYARTLLRPAPATRIVLEVMQQANAAPLSHTLDHATTVLAANTKKAVSIGGPIALAGGAQDFTADQIRALADQNSKNAQTGDQAVVHLLYLHGTFNGDTSVLGISVRGDTTAVFVDQVRQAATPIAPRSTIEDAVTEHELGHLLGLVDLVLHTGRGDPAHPGHSQNQNSVMYWAIESNLVGQVLNGPPPVDFDDADRADLATIRSGG